MKKLALVLFSGMFLLSIASCKKCAQCSNQDVYYSGEYCKGNTIKNAIYESAKSECESAGGTFK